MPSKKLSSVNTPPQSSVPIRCASPIKHIIPTTNMHSELFFVFSFYLFLDVILDVFLHINNLHENIFSFRWKFSYFDNYC